MRNYEIKPTRYGVGFYTCSIVEAAVLALLVAAALGTFLFWAWPRVITEIAPKAVEDGYLSARLGWFTCCVVTYIPAFLFILKLDT